MARTTRSMGAAEIENLPDTMKPAEERPTLETKRTTKRATGVKKAKIAPAPVVPPTYPTTPSTPHDRTAQEWIDWEIKAEDYYQYYRDRRTAARNAGKRKRARAKEEEDIIKAADIYDSEDEQASKPKKRMSRRDKWAKRLADREKSMAPQQPEKDTKDYYRPDDPCYLFRVPREIRDVIYGYVFTPAQAPPPQTITYPSGYEYVVEGQPECTSYRPFEVTDEYSKRLLWKLPGIFTACKTTYEESKPVWVSKSTVNLSLKNTKFRTALDRFGANARGLRTNKSVDTGTAFLESLLKFSRLNIKVDNFWRKPLKDSQHTTLEYAMKFLEQADLPKNKIIVLDLSTVFHFYSKKEHSAILKCVDTWMPQLPQLKLAPGRPKGSSAYSYYAPYKAAEEAVQDFIEKRKDRVWPKPEVKPIAGPAGKPAATSSHR